MRIGILTFHKPVNYGAVLQAYALSNKLAKDFPDCTVEIIDYIAPKEFAKKYTNILRRIKKNGLQAGIIEFQKVKNFSSYYKVLNLSTSSFIFSSIKHIYDYIERTYDLLIIGSDAVYNWNQNGFPSIFLPNRDINIPILSYAASVHGLDYYNEAREKIEICKKCFEKMAFISVRDKCTEEFVHYCNSEATVFHACDPTLLLDFEMMENEKQRSYSSIFRKHNIPENKDYIILMLQDERISEKIYKRYHDQYTIISLFMNNKYSDAYLYDLNPFEWAKIIKRSKLVITNYFHGTLLALEQNVPAIAIDLSHYFGKYEGKLKDLMNRRLCLPELYYMIEGLKTDREIGSMMASADDALKHKFDTRIEKALLSEKSSYSLFFKKISELMLEQ